MVISKVWKDMFLNGDILGSEGYVLPWYIHEVNLMGLSS